MYVFQTTPIINNSTTAQDAKLALYSYVIPVMGALVIIINLTVVVSSGLILKKCQNPRSTYLLLGNVAMSDLLTGIAILVGKLYPKSKRNHHVCAIEMGLIISSTLASVYSVGLIAVDRYLYILYGMQYQRWVYCKRVRAFIALSWVIGCIVGFLPLMGWHGDTNNGQTCWFIFLAPDPLIILTVNVGILPLILVLVLYSIISYRAIQKIYQYQSGEDTAKKMRMFRGKTKKIDENDKSSGIFKIFKTRSRPYNVSNKWKAVKVVVFTTLIFTLTWLPYYIACIIYLTKCKRTNLTKRCETIQHLIASPLAILGFANSFLNPLVYAWWHRSFRDDLKKRWQVILLKRKNKLSLKSDHKFSSRNTSLSETKRSAQSINSNI